MIIFKQRRCSSRQKEAIDEILSNDKFTVLSVVPEEGFTKEINNNLNYEELFNLHRKFRKKYFKLKNYE